MKKIYKTILLSVFFLTSFSSAYSQHSAIYSTNNSGTLDGVPFAFSNTVGGTQINNFNLSGTDYSALPLSSSQSTFNYESTENWILTFDSPIQNLKLFLVYWKNLEIEFSEPFTIKSGGATLLNPSGNILKTTNFTHGIIEFNNPITTLSINVIVGAPGYQIALTLGVGDATLSSNNFVLNDENIKLYPNPSRGFIQISGLTKIEKYTIYSIIGSEIKSGDISNNDKIYIQEMKKGVYFLKLDNGDTIKFIKE